MADPRALARPAIETKKGRTMWPAQLFKSFVEETP